MSDKVQAWGEPQVVDALRMRYPANEWALLAGVRNATGFSSARTRTADAVALNLWPSKGMPLIGFEIKSSRSDWKRELEQPEKSEEIARFMDQWWIVAGVENIVDKAELPKTWGLLERKGDALKVVKMAPQLPDPLPLTKGFIASLFRETAAQMCGDDEVERRTNMRINKLMDEYKRRLDKTHEAEINRLKYDIEAYKKESERWRNAIGLDTIDNRWRYTPEQIGAIVQSAILSETMPRDMLVKLTELREFATSVLANMTGALDKLKNGDIK